MNTVKIVLMWLLVACTFFMSMSTMYLGNTVLSLAWTIAFAGWTAALFKD
jgi:hypothetical protein